ncbi:MAG TPA: hypothetical protein VH853_11230 [Polyangia bacterium]|jgi:hypothetical protein|nr:hypothetical protein [Polyangia bacterium]
MHSRQDDGAETWLANEPPLGPALRGRLARLIRRGLASWYVWIPLAVGVSFVVAVKSVRRRSFEATVILRVTEGDVRSAGIDLGAGVLRTYVDARAFTSQNLIELMSRHPRAFSDLRSEPAESIQAIRSGIELAISDNDFVEDRGRDDPPRSARISITYHAGEPALALAVARELAELVVASTLSLEKQALARAQTATASALDKAEAQFDTQSERRQQQDGDGPLRGDDALAELAQGRVRAMVALAADARLANRAVEEKQTLQFDMVDMGRLPPTGTKAFFLQELAVTLGLTLLGGLFLAGGFDPRILDRIDLAAVGLRALAETPALPRRRQARGASPPSTRV